MGLFRKIFSNDKSSQVDGGSPSHFDDSVDSQDSNASDTEVRNAPRRELIHMVLRDTMRLYAIPSDWIDCRLLTDGSKGTRAGLHVQLTVRQGADRMLAYVPTFQKSFKQDLTKFDPRASDWLLSLTWEFEGLEDKPQPAPMSAAASAVAVALPKNEEDDEVSRDLQALFAIRDAALKDTASNGHVDFQPTRPGA